ncbi:MAG: hypothetical protein QXT93_02470 [Thermofilum sp.]
MGEVWRSIRLAASMLAVTALLLLAAGIMLLSLSPPEKREGLLQIVPCASGVEAVANASTRFARKPLGVAWVDPNVWGAGLAGSEGLEGHARVLCEPGGPLRIEVDFRSPRWGSPIEVLAYPSVAYGLKPWNRSADLQGGVEPLPLPLRLRELPTITLSVEYRVLEPSERFNVAYDLWIVRKPAAGVRPGDLEVMVWLSWRNSTPLGYLAKVVKIPVFVNGSARELEWEVWVASREGEGWDYVAFLPRQALAGGAVSLNLNLFIDYSLSTLSELRPGRWYPNYAEELYLASIELGSEVFRSPTMLLRWEILRYEIVVQP